MYLQVQSKCFKSINSKHPISSHTAHRIAVALDYVKVEKGGTLHI